MDVIIIQRYRWHAALIMSLVLGNLNGSPNQINKVFHHQAPSDNLEVGQIVLYFTHDPIIKTTMTHVSEKKDEVTFLFSQTELTEQARSMLAAIASHTLASNNYSLELNANKQQKDSVLKIVFDPRKIVCDYATFVAIDTQKGVVIRLYNKELLDRLDAGKHKVMIRTASNHTKPQVIIDCGHGGKDTGAISASGLKEKDLALDVGLQLASSLESDGWKVLLPRSDDQFVELDERTKLANFRGDLLISIHANNSPRCTARGIETFALTPKLFKPGQAISTSKTIVSAENMRAQRFNESIKLASCLQAGMFDSVKKKYADVVNRGVKHSVAQVLLGTVVGPSALVEIGFIADPCINQPAYKNAVVQGLRNGINSFCKACS